MLSVSRNYLKGDNYINIIFIDDATLITTSKADQNFSLLSLNY